MFRSMRSDAGELGEEQLLAAVRGKAAFKKSDLLVALFDSPVAQVEAALQALLKAKRVVKNGDGTFSVASGGKAAKRAAPVPDMPVAGVSMP